MSNVLLQTCRLQNMFLTKFIKLSNSKRKLKEAKDNNKGVSDPTFFNKKIKKRAIQDDNMVFRQIYSILHFNSSSLYFSEKVTKED